MMTIEEYQECLDLIDAYVEYHRLGVIECAQGAHARAQWAVKKLAKELGGEIDERES